MPPTPNQRPRRPTNTVFNPTAYQQSEWGMTPAWNQPATVYGDESIKIARPLAGPGAGQPLIQSPNAPNPSLPLSGPGTIRTTRGNQFGVDRPQGLSYTANPVTYNAQLPAPGYNSWFPGAPAPAWTPPGSPAWMTPSNPPQGPNRPTIPTGTFLGAGGQAIRSNDANSFNTYWMPQVPADQLTTSVIGAGGELVNTGNPIFPVAPPLGDQPQGGFGSTYARWRRGGRGGYGGYGGGGEYMPSSYLNLFNWNTGE